MMGKYESAGIAKTNNVTPRLIWIWEKEFWKFQPE
jgi:hypothetical protein